MCDYRLHLVEDSVWDRPNMDKLLQLGLVIFFRGEFENECSIWLAKFYVDTAVRR